MLNIQAVLQEKCNLLEIEGIKRKMNDYMW